MKKTSTLVSLSEKGRRIRDALACGQIIIDALKLATVLLSKEPDLYTYMQDNNYPLATEPPARPSTPEKVDVNAEVIKMEKKR